MKTLNTSILLNALEQEFQSDKEMIKERNPFFIYSADKKDDNFLKYTYAVSLKSKDSNGNEEYNVVVFEDINKDFTEKLINAIQGEFERQGVTADIRTWSSALTYFPEIWPSKLDKANK